MIQRYGLTFLISFAISAGGAYLTAAANGVPPTMSGVITMVVGALVTGAVAGAQAVQKLMETPPVP